MNKIITRTRSKSRNSIRRQFWIPPPPQFVSWKKDRSGAWYVHVHVSVSRDMSSRHRGLLPLPRGVAGLHAKTNNFEIQVLFRYVIQMHFRYRKINSGNIYIGLLILVSSAIGGWPSSVQSMFCRQRPGTTLASIKYITNASSYSIINLLWVLTCFQYFIV